MGACQSSMREHRLRGPVVEGGTKDGQGDEECEGILRRAYTASANHSIHFTVVGSGNQHRRADDSTSYRLDPFLIRYSRPIRMFRPGGGPECDRKVWFDIREVLPGALRMCIINGCPSSDRK